MKLKHALYLTGILLLLASASEAKIKALIIDGQNNHAVWPKSTVMMKQYLEKSGLFEVDIDRTRYTWRGEFREAKWLPRAGVTKQTEDLEKSKSDPDFKPSFEEYDVVISNFGFKAADWPEETRAAFESYMKNGGGFVSVHAADNCFGHWHEYNRMIGLGGWGGRNERHGPYVYYNNAGEFIRDETTPGAAGSHGTLNEIQITMRDMGHPITRGLPKYWITSRDECYAKLRGPAVSMTVLATGKDTSEKAPTDRHEPILMVIDYGKGRIFHTTLGHDTSGFEGVGFIATFLRGAEWAATGRVTQEVPADFPAAHKSITRLFKYKE